MGLFLLLSSVYLLIHANIDLDDVILNNVNNDIDPCDDFYQHATSTLKTPFSSYFEDLVHIEYEFDKANRTYSTMFGSMDGINDTVTVTNFTEKIRKICHGEHGILSELVLSELDEYSAGKCIAYLEMAVEFFDDTTSMLESFAASMRIVEDNVQIYNFMRETGCNFPAAQTLFLHNELRKMTMEEISNTEWNNNYNLTQSALERLNTLKIHDIVEDLKPSYDFYANIPEYLRECYTDLDASNLNDVLFCRMLLTTLLLKSKFNKPKDEYNGAYYSRTNEIVYLPASNIMAKNQQMAAKMCVGSTILHEFGHVVYHSIVKEVRKTNRTPKALECVRTSSNRVCNLFNKTDSEYCDHRMDSLHEDTADFMMMMMINKLMNFLFEDSEEFFDRKAAQLFFYSYAQTYGYTNETDITDVHSYIGDRINMVARQSNVFSKAFKCKAGDRMFASEDEKCFLTGPRAPITKSRDEKKLYNYFFSNVDMDDSRDC